MSESPTNPPPRRRIPRWLLSVLLVLSIICFISALLLPLPWKKLPELPPGSQVMPFALTERSGKPVSNDDLMGKVWVASFVFTRCTGPCPSVTATMARLQSELDLANQPDLRLVTFTVDPDRDTPDELKKYAENFRAHPDRWLFLTGKEDEVHRLAKYGFKVAVERSQNPMPPEGQEFDHSTRLIVIDKKGQIRGYFDGFQGPNDTDGKQYADSINRLKITVNAILKE